MIRHSIQFQISSLLLIIKLLEFLYKIYKHMESSDMYSKKAEQCLKEGKKKLKGSFFGNLTTGKQQRAEEALECFKQAATNFKLAKRWDDAVNAYLECIECDRICKGGQSAEFYVEAANLKEKTNSGQCVKLLEMAISLHVQNNRISNVAKIQKRIAQIYQKDNEFTLAIKNYREAAQNFSLEQNQSSSYNACMLKIVDIGIYATPIDYAELIKILETIADKYLQNKLTAPSAKQLEFKGVLLYLANDDIVGASQALKKYMNNDPTFENTRQHKFCVGLIKSINEANLPLFSEECYKFNEIIPFDKWKTSVLTKIKSRIPENGSAQNVNVGGNNYEQYSQKAAVNNDDDEL